MSRTQADVFRENYPEIILLFQRLSKSKKLRELGQVCPDKGIISLTNILKFSIIDDIR